jgi:hypothetical protein
MGVFIELVQDYEDAFMELVLFGQKKIWNDDDIKKQCFI